MVDREVSRVGKGKMGCHGRARTGKGLDLFPNDVNASVIAGVQLQNHLSHVLGPVYPSRQSEDGGRLPGTRRAVEEEMG